MVVEQAYRSTVGHGRQCVRFSCSARSGVRGCAMCSMAQPRTPLLAEQTVLLGYEFSEFDKPVLGCNRWGRVSSSSEKHTSKSCRYMQGKHGCDTFRNGALVCNVVRVVGETYLIMQYAAHTVGL